jgi:hypothetical protein
VSIDGLWTDLVVQQSDVFCLWAASEIIAKSKELASYVLPFVGDFQPYNVGQAVGGGHGLIQDIVVTGGEDDLTGLTNGAATFFFQGLPGAGIV